MVAYMLANVSHTLWYLCTLYIPIYIPCTFTHVPSTVIQLATQPVPKMWAVKLRLPWRHHDDDQSHQRIKRSWIAQVFPQHEQRELDKKSIDMSNLTTNQFKDVKNIVQDKFQSAQMLNRVNKPKYGDLKQSMAKNYVTGYSRLLSIDILFLSNWNALWFDGNSMNRYHTITGCLACIGKLPSLGGWYFVFFWYCKLLVGTQFWQVGGNTFF